MAEVCVVKCDRKLKFGISKKGGTRVGVGRPIAGGVSIQCNLDYLDLVYPDP